ncbi:hypothetical protein CCACVL1_17079 [Corchorus capsularis]|uniref:Uncharacterized protein n=1 Tax=Corchorus capsularis TaxID=210143 RepID=A0A1R3HU65_COCAP|nr:hypothetical protein CCACVL1_17079 [Corchorus capsularis]
MAEGQTSYNGGVNFLGEGV